MKKNNKGFTLVELLAVIVVLAVIMVIATQQITKVIKQNTAKSFQSSLDMAVKQAEMYYTSNGEYPTDETAWKSVLKYDTNEYSVSATPEGVITLTATANGKFGKIECVDFGEADGNTCTGNSSSKTLKNGYTYNKTNHTISVSLNSTPEVIEP